MDKENSNQNLMLIDIIKIVWKNKWFIAVVNFIIVLSAVAYSLLADEVYEVTTTLIPAEVSDEISLKNISMLGGLSIGISQESPVVQMIRNNLYSDSFLRKYYKKYADDPNITKAKSSTKKITEEEKFEIFLEKFKTGILKFESNSDANLLTIGIRLPDRKFANKLLNEILTDLKETIRNKNIETVKNDIVFYKNIADSTSDSKVQNVLSEIITEKIKKSYTMTNNIFVVLDPPNYPHKRYWPKRTKIVLVAGILGFIFSLLVLTVKVSVQDFIVEIRKNMKNVS